VSCFSKIWLSLCANKLAHPASQKCPEASPDGSQDDVAAAGSVVVEQRLAEFDDGTEDGPDD